MLFAYYIGKNLIPLREQGNKAKFWKGTRKQTKKKQGNMGTLPPPPRETLSSLKTSEPGKIAHKTGSKISARRTQRSNEICPWALMMFLKSIEYVLSYFTKLKDYICSGRMQDPHLTSSRIACRACSNALVRLG